MARYRRSGGRWSFPEHVYTQLFTLYRSKESKVVPGASLAFYEDLLGPKSRFLMKTKQHNQFWPQKVKKNVTKTSNLGLNENKHGA